MHKRLMLLVNSLGQISASCSLRSIYKEYFLKALKLVISTVCIALFINGCSSHQDMVISGNGNAVKYESRCRIHERSKEENLAHNSHELLVATKSPIYPVEAARKGIEGYTILEFDISSEGKPINIRVIEAYPSDVFNSAAIEAFSEWRYKPQSSSCHAVQHSFKLD